MNAVQITLYQGPSKIKHYSFRKFWRKLQQMAALEVIQDFTFVVHFLWSVAQCSLFFNVLGIFLYRTITVKIGTSLLLPPPFLLRGLSLWTLLLLKLVQSLNNAFACKL